MTTSRPITNPTRRSGRARPGTPPGRRWTCPCRHSPVLLATYEPDGRVNVKVRDRYWHFTGFGEVRAVCPRCATEHVLDLREPDHDP